MEPFVQSQDRINDWGLCSEPFLGGSFERCVCFAKWMLRVSVDLSEVKALFWVDRPLTWGIVLPETADSTCPWIHLTSMRKCVSCCTCSFKQRCCFSVTLKMLQCMKTRKKNEFFHAILNWQNEEMVGGWGNNWQGYINIASRIWSYKCFEYVVNIFLSIKALLWIKYSTFIFKYML